MALSILQYPASCSLAQSPIVFSVSESSAANTSASFQYNADLYYWTGTTAQSGSVPNYVLVKYPNASNVGIFDFSRIINSTLTDLREQNPSNVVYFKGDFYFTFLSGSSFRSGSRTSSGVYKALDGYSIFQEPINQQITSKSLYWPIMTDGPSTQSIFPTNKGTLGVYTGAGCNSGVNYLLYSSSLTSSYVQVSSSISTSQQIQQAPGFPSETGFPITYTDSYKICPVSSSVSSSIEEVITNVSASFFSLAMNENEADFTIDLEAQVLNNANSICWYTGSSPLYVIALDVDGVFDFNGDLTDCAEVRSIDCVTGVVELENLYIISALGEGYTGSLVFANSCSSIDNIFTSSSFVTQNTTVFNQVEECLYFEEICQQKYPNVRVKWKNRYGQFDYHNFYLVNRQSFSTTNRSYQPQLGSWENNTLGYNDYDSSKLNYIVDSEQFISANSGYIDEDYNEIFKQLLVSEEIYWVYDDDETKLRPITIATQNVIFKTGVVDKLIQYQFDFQFGQGYKLIL
jgi:hypothetical protein